MITINSFYPKWFTKAEAADYLRVCEKTISRSEKAGFLTGHYLTGSKTKRYRREDLDALMEAA